MIKILTGYSEKGGSTVALSTLTNSLNGAGYETIMYGPHDYHLGLCKSGKLTQEVIDGVTQNDVVITHFLKLPKRPNAKKVVLACHEKWWFDVGGINQYWDEVIFLHQAHADYHKENLGKYKGEYSIIPNLKYPLFKKEKTELDKVAGIIGAIEDRKQTHISIQRALKDKCDKIYLFGKVGEASYYQRYVKPLVSLPKIIEYGHADDKQSMYDMVGRVYHSSKGEVACLVKDECWSTGTQFFGNVETEHEVSPLSNLEIIELWIKNLGV
jgi:hypothetical protein